LKTCGLYILYTPENYSKENQKKRREKEKKKKTTSNCNWRLSFFWEIERNL